MREQDNMEMARMERELMKNGEENLEMRRQLELSGKLVEDKTQTID